MDRSDGEGSLSDKTSHIPRYKTRCRGLVNCIAADSQCSDEFFEIGKRVTSKARKANRAAEAAKAAAKTEKAAKSAAKSAAETVKEPAKGTEKKANGNGKQNKGKDGAKKEKGKEAEAEKKLNKRSSHVCLYTLFFHYE